MKIIRRPSRSPDRPPRRRKPPRSGRSRTRPTAGPPVVKPRSSWIDGSAAFRDRHVEDDHEVGDAEDCERLPAQGIGRGLRHATSWASGRCFQRGGGRGYSHLAGAGYRERPNGVRVGGARLPTLRWKQTRLSTMCSRGATPARKASRSRSSRRRAGSAASCRPCSPARSWRSSRGRPGGRTARARGR